jgi:ATP-dependent DNA helicase RecG
MTENQNIEYKESWHDEYLKWICGYANAQGGVLYIGLNDKGTVVGLKNSKKLLEDLPNKIRDVLGIVADVNLHKKKGLDYIKIIVHPSSYPVDYKGEYHYRSGSTKQLLTGAALTQFLMRKTGSKWDAVVLDDATVEDLDKESFDIFKREAKRSGRMTDSDLQLSDEELLNHLNLLKDGKLKRAAVLLFHRNPEKWFTGVYTKIGKFTGSEIDYMDEVHGSLILQADRVIDLIYLKYLKAAVSYQKDTRVELYPFAREAIRETYFNALCHSDWSGCVPIQIKIEEEQMFISNICLFPEGWTAETLMKDHNSVPFNPDIANTFYRAGYIEAWGRGIKKICDACKELGAKEPEYIIHGHDVMVRFESLHTHESQEKSQEKNIKRNAITEKIIDILKKNPDSSMKEISLKCGVTESWVYKTIKKLKAQEMVYHIGPDKGGHWKVNTKLLERE